MKTLITLATMILLPLLAQAGDNGSYLDCKSASGRTQFIYGQVGSGIAPTTIELLIDGATFGAENAFDVDMRADGNYSILRFDNENAKFGQKFLFVRLGQQDRNGFSKATVMSGLDPRTQKELTHEIQLSCKLVANPI